MNRKLLDFIRLADGKAYAGPQEHERRVGRWLKEVGFKHTKYQPYGKFNPPDWIVKVGHRWIEVECKSSLKSEISFNNTPPSKDTLYIFCSKKHDDTMVFFGGDVYKRGIRQIINTYIRKVRALERKFTDICVKSTRSNPFGFIPGFRPRIRQKGGAKITDFFIPQIRELLVKKAKQRKL